MTWSNLIKKYNSQAQGNVEHFSICSEDSIWQETEHYDMEESPNSSPCSATMDHSYTVQNSNFEEEEDYNFSQENNKYKNHIMEKYLQDLNICQNETIRDINPKNNTQHDESPRILSKWLQSAANFRPRQKNYVNWDFNGKKPKSLNKALQQNGQQVSSNQSFSQNNDIIQHGREELDAAEALTRLASAHAVVI